MSGWNALPMGRESFCPCVLFGFCTLGRQNGMLCLWVVSRFLLVFRLGFAHCTCTAPLRLRKLGCPYYPEFDLWRRVWFADSPSQTRVNLFPSLRKLLYDVIYTITYMTSCDILFELQYPLYPSVEQIS